MHRPRPPDRIARAAFGAEVVYLALAFGWRSWLHWRRTGDTGFRLSRRSPTADRVASLSMVAGAALGAAATAAAAAAPGRPGGRRAVRVLGLGLLVASVVGTVRAQLALGESWRVGVDADERTDLVTSGTYALVRNPIFTWMAAASFGGALVVGTPVGWLGAALLLAGVELQVRLVEEPYLDRAHGEAFAVYADRTGRFLPGIGRRRAAF